MQVNDTRKTVVAFVVLPEFTFKVRRFSAMNCRINKLKFGDPYKNAYNSRTVRATSECRTYLES